MRRADVGAGREIVQTQSEEATPRELARAAGEAGEWAGGAGAGEAWVGSSLPRLARWDDNNLYLNGKYGHGKCSCGQERARYSTSKA